MIKKALASVGQQPILAIQFCIHSVQIVVGAMIISPWPASASPSLAHGLQSVFAVNIYAGLLILLGVVGLYALKNLNWPLRERVMSGTIFFTFLLFTFFTILRLTIHGPTNLVWFSYLLNALVSGVVYLRLRWLAKL